MDKKENIENIDISRKSILEKLYKLEDKQYAQFTSKIVPTVDKEKFIGVRVPNLRALAKQIKKAKKQDQYLQNTNLQNAYYFEEYMLYAIVLNEVTDYNQCVQYVDNFLPYIDNWAVCDILSPKAFKVKKKNNKENNKENQISTKLLEYIKELLKQASKNTKDKEHPTTQNVYKIRFAICMLMQHFLDDEYKKEYLQIPANVQEDEYYINMVIAWFFQNALVKRWDDAIVYLEKRKLREDIHKKAIQKAIDSFKISKEQKEYLKTLR